eukprot:177919-Chlamydomonas_euryale.AAC.1
MAGGEFRPSGAQRHSGRCVDTLDVVWTLWTLCGHSGRCVNTLDVVWTHGGEEEAGGWRRGGAEAGGGDGAGKEAGGGGWVEEEAVGGVRGGAEAGGGDGVGKEAGGGGRAEDCSCGAECSRTVQSGGQFRGSAMLRRHAMVPVWPSLGGRVAKCGRVCGAVAAALWLGACGARGRGGAAAAASAGGPLIAARPRPPRRAVQRAAPCQPAGVAGVDLGGVHPHPQRGRTEGGEGHMQAGHGAQRLGALRLANLLLLRVWAAHDHTEGVGSTRSH